MKTTSKVVTAKVFKNGNSRAVRIPGSLQPSIRAGDIVELRIKKSSGLRHNWAQQFKEALKKDANTSIVDKYGSLTDSASDGLEGLDDDWNHL